MIEDQAIEVAEDYSRIRAENRALFRLMKEGRAVDDNSEEVCTRGIIDCEIRQIRNTYREEALDCVIWEQKRQYMAGIIDEEKLRSVLVWCTKVAMEEAIARAQEDQLAASVPEVRICPVPAVKKAVPQTGHRLSPSLLLHSTACRLPSPQQRRSIDQSPGDLVAILDDALAILEPSTVPPLTA